MLLTTLLLAAGGAAPLVVHGPGGTFAPMRECAAMYAERQGVSVRVIKRPPAASLPVEVDLYFAGSEDMLADVDGGNPGVLDMKTATKLYPRRIGIIVRRGNPRGIATIADLGRPGLRLLEAELEEMAALRGPHEVYRLVATGQEAAAQWSSLPELDAWVTYASWHRQLEAVADFVPLSGLRAVRHVLVAVTRGTRQRDEALRFVAFLKSDEAHRVFVRHGWD